MRYFTYQSRGHMATTRLHKLAYLAQLHSYDSVGQPVTDLVFIRYKHGPWSPDLSEVIEDFEAGAEDVLVETTPSDHGIDRRFRPAKRKTTVTWTDNGKLVLRDMWAKLGYVPTQVLVAVCKSGSLFKRTALAEIVDFVVYAQRREQALKALEKMREAQTLSIPAWGFEWAVTKEEAGFSAENQDLPGCITQGDTFEELEANMLEVLLAYLEDRVKAVEVLV